MCSNELLIEDLLAVSTSYKSLAQVGMKACVILTPVIGHSKVLGYDYAGVRSWFGATLKVNFNAHVAVRFERKPGIQSLSRLQDKGTMSCPDPSNIGAGELPSMDTMLVSEPRLRPRLQS